MLNKKTQLSFIIVIIFFLVGFFLINRLTPSPLSLIRRGGGERSENIKYIKIAGQIIKVELALTSEEQAQGLSGRPGLNNNEGMLFVFSAEGGSASGGQAPRFWMKDMNFPIDIIWLAPSLPRLAGRGGGGEDLRVVYIKKDARPESYPETYGPDEEAKYVLEVVSGFSDKNDLKVGERVEL